VATTTDETGTAIGVRDLLEAGLHFGHQTKRWNPKMKRYIFDKRNGIHIIDLAKSVVMLQAALEYVHEVVITGRSILFVGTKKQAQKVMTDVATECNQHYVTHRWLGGTLTNRATLRRSIQRMRHIEVIEKSDGFATMHKKEAAAMRRELTKLRRNLLGVANMNELPGVMFVVDINRESIAINEANTLGIPVVAIVDTCCDPDPVDFVIPGNDDAIRAIKLIAGAMGDTIKSAAAEYERVAAEDERKRQAEEKARKEAAEVKKAEAAAKKAEAEKVAAETAKKKQAEKASKAAEAKKKAAEAPAAEAPAVEAPATDAAEAALEKAAPAEESTAAPQDETPAEAEPKKETE